MKNYKIFIYSFVFMVGSIYAQDNIINEIAKGGKFIVRDEDQNDAMVIEEGNVGINGTLKLGVLPKGNYGNSIVVWDPDDKKLKIMDQNLQLDTDNTESWHSFSSEEVDDAGNLISSSVQGAATVNWNVFTTDNGTINLGPANNYYAHIYTDRTRFLFNKPITFVDAKFGSQNNQDFRFETGGISRLIVKGITGNIGIGTTGPGAKLEVAGQVKITGGTPGLGKVLTSDGTGLATWQTPTAGGGTTLWTESGSNIYRTDGNVGIGTTTPSEKFVVQGNALIGNNTSSSFMHVGNNYFSNVANSLNPGMYVYKNGPIAYGMKLQYTGSEYGTMMFGPNTSNTFLSFGKVGSALEDDNMIEYMRVDLDNGNVGIGTTNPSTKLDVNGTMSVNHYVINSLNEITNGIWDLSLSNLAQITYSSGITPITINSDGKAGTYVLVIKKVNSCTDCNITFLGVDVKFPSGVNPTLSSGPNTTDIFSFIADGNNTFYCLYAKNLL